MSKKKDGRRTPASKKASTPKKKEFEISVSDHIDLQNRYIRLLEKSQGAPSAPKQKKSTKKAKPKKAKATPKKVKKVKKTKSTPAPKGVEAEILSTLQNMQGEMTRRGRQLNELSRGNAQG